MFIEAHIEAYMSVYLCVSREYVLYAHDCPCMCIDVCNLYIIYAHVYFQSFDMTSEEASSRIRPLPVSLAPDEHASQASPAAFAASNPHSHC